MRFIEFLVFTIRFLQSSFVGNLAVIGENVIAAKREKLIHAAFKFLHRKGVFTLDQILYIIEVSRNGTLQLTYLLFLQIILGYSDVGFQNTSVGSVLPRRQPHMLLAFVSAVINDLCDSLIGDRIMKFVLHGRVKALGDIGGFVVVDTALGKNIGDLLPDPALACTDRANSFELFPEVVLAEGGVTLFEPVIIKCKALDHILF